jgi:4-hydroxy 2-oxovalerate aldolase
VKTGIDKDILLAAAENVVQPYSTRLPVMDRLSIVQGFAGVYSSFLLHAVRAAQRYGVTAHEVLYRVGANRAARRT